MISSLILPGISEVRVTYSPFIVSSFLSSVVRSVFPRWDWVLPTTLMTQVRA